MNKYDIYDAYIKYQKVKTTDQDRIHKWQNDEWEIKYNGFREIFSRNNKYIKNKNNATCLGSRTGQEIKALQDLGLNAIGVDLVAFPPYTVEGDIHNLKYDDSLFDKCKLLESKSINNLHDKMHWECIFERVI